FVFFAGIDEGALLAGHRAVDFSFERRSIYAWLEIQQDQVYRVVFPILLVEFPVHEDRTLFNVVELHDADNWSGKGAVRCFQMDRIADAQTTSERLILRDYETLRAHGLVASLLRVAGFQQSWRIRKPKIHVPADLHDLVISVLHWRETHTIGVFDPRERAQSPFLLLIKMIGP